MNLAKKALSLGTSVALVASLVATVALPTAFAAVTVGSAGNVPVGGTSAAPATFTFTEQSATSLTNATGYFTVTITPALPGAGSVTFSGTPSVAGSTGSLGASASLIAPNVLQVKIGGSDITQVESIFVSGLYIKAAAGTTPGAIVATLGIPATVPNQFASAAAVAAAFSANSTATGYVSNPIGANATSVVVAVTSSCLFAQPAASGTAALTFGTNPDSSVTIAAGGASALGVPVAGEQTITLSGTGTTNAHLANELVTEANACAGTTALASPGTVVAALTFNTPNNPVVYPGEFNSAADPLVLVEPSAGFLPAASTITYTIATPGVVFSSVPLVTNGDSALRTLTWATGTLLVHPAGATVTQAQTPALPAAPCTASGTLVNALLVGAVSALVNLTTPLCPFLPTALGTVGNIVFTSTTDTGPLGAVSTPAGQVLSGPVLSADRTSATVTVKTASSVAPSTITLYNILYDVASTVPGGTYVKVGVTTSGGLAVNPASNTNAVVFRGISASATSPTVYIGENNQTAGIISFTESQAGFFTAGTGTGTNVFSVCPKGVNYTFTVAPYAMVVGGTAAGNLILRDGSAASATNIVQGTLNAGCYTWYVWTASTTASTIKIGGVGVTAGPLINVAAGQAPGGVDVNLFDSNSNLNQPAQYLFATVQFATAVYRNQVAVTALSQPSFPAGTVHGAGGNVQIAETGVGQLKANELICFEVLYRSGEYQDQFLNGLNTADLPVATASGTGLVIGPVVPESSSCESMAGSPPSPIVNVPMGYMQAFAFPVYQQSTAGDGKVVISNISYTTLTNAANGPVQLSVWGFGGAPTSVIFHSTLSDATVGAMPGLSISALSALGLNPTSGYSTTSLKVQAKGKYVTWKFTGGSALAGQKVTIWVTTATIPGVWGPWKPLTLRLADANGIATFWWKSNTKTSVSVRAEWLGNASNGDSLSPARGATWH